MTTCFVKLTYYFINKTSDLSEKNAPADTYGVYMLAATFFFLPVKKIFFQLM